MTECQPEPANDLASVPRLSLADRRFRPIDEDDEPMGGDPPCWAHLFEDDERPGVE